MGDMPKAIRTPEAVAQLHVSWWRFIEAVFAPYDRLEPIRLYADSRAVDALTRALDLRAALVGRDRALVAYGHR